MKVPISVQSTVNQTTPRRGPSRKVKVGVGSIRSMKNKLDCQATLINRSWSELSTMLGKYQACITYFWKITVNLTAVYDFIILNCPDFCHSITWYLLQSGQVRGHTLEQCTNTSKLRWYSFNLCLVVDQADSRTLMSSTWCNHEECCLSLNWCLHNLINKAI